MESEINKSFSKYLSWALLDPLIVETNYLDALQCFLATMDDHSPIL